MVGVATGLAEAGFVPFVYSIATFAALRPYEFIRNGPVLHHLPVRIVGVGGGLEYGTNGLTHYALEDIAVMRTQPGMTVLAPADFEQARTALMRDLDVAGPIYFRLGKDETADGAGPRRAIRARRASSSSAPGATWRSSPPARSRTRRPRPSSCCEAAGMALAPRGGGSPEPVARRGAGPRAAQRVARGHRGGALPVRRARLARRRGDRRAGLGCRLVRCGVAMPAGLASGARHSSTTRTACRRARSREPAIEALDRRDHDRERRSSPDEEAERRHRLLPRRARRSRTCTSG